MAAKKKVDPIKQREKRAKIAAGVGVVLLIAVGAYEVPSMMAVMNKKPPAGAEATDAGNRNPDGSIPLPNVASTSTGLVSSGALTDTDVPPSAQEAQLVSFSVFETKNPFRPQVTDSAGTVSSSSTPVASTPTTTTTTPSTTITTPASTTPAATTPATTMSVTPTPPATGSAVPSSPTPSTPVTPTVALKVNGTVSRVGSQGTFPAGTPVFRLVSWTKETAQVGIVGGSYSTGDATLTLHVGKPVTLENTSNGKTYRLELISTP